MVKNVVRVVLSTLVVSMILSCQAQESISVFNWISYMPEELLEEFTKETGIAIKYEEFDSSEQMLAKITSGGKYDVAFPGIDFVPLMIEKGLLAEIDKSLVPNFSNIDADVIAQTQVADPGNRFSLPYNIGAIGIMYWKDRVTNPGTSISILENPEYKGKTLLLDDTREIFGVALRTLGYSVNSTNPAEIQAATDLILKWKDNSLGFDNAQMITLMANKDVWVALGYLENVMSELDEETKAGIGYFIPQEKGAKFLDMMVILADSEKKEAAHKFINFIYRPENLAKIFDLYGYPGISQAAAPFRTQQPYYTAAELVDHEFKNDLGPAIDLYTKAWEEQIKIGN